MSLRTPALVVLAAGESERLGTCKALVRLREREPATPLALLLAAGAALDTDEALIVTGPDHAAIAAATPPGVQVVRNPEWSSGRTGSVRTAAELLPGRALCLTPVDVPLVPPEVFAALARAWARAGAPGRGWLGPWVSAGPGLGERRFGHPVVLGPELLARVAEGAPGTPLSAFRARAEPLLAVEVRSGAILDDLDGPGDLAELRARLESPDA